MENCPKHQCPAMIKLQGLALMRLAADFYGGDQLQQLYLELHTANDQWYASEVEASVTRLY
jgi:hypothetical protein